MNKTTLGDTRQKAKLQIVLSEGC